MRSPSTDEKVGIVGRLEEFFRRHARPGNRLVVTSRVAGYNSVPLSGDFVHFRTRDMDRDQVELFLRRWCTAVEDAETPDASPQQRQSVATAEIEAILRAFDDSPGVARLAVNPLMLRVLALIHRTGARLPQKRVELYKLAADTLSRTWRLAQGVPESALAKEEHVTRLLSTLAYWLHTNRPSGIAREDEVLTVLGPEWAKITGVAWDPEDPSMAIMSEVRAFIETVRIQTGLFVERAPRRYGFLHLTFEEYFAARALIARPRTRPQRIRELLHDRRWMEPILLALGFVGLDYPEDSAELVEAAVLARGEAAEDLNLKPSPLEDLLGRDFLFALRCLADEIPLGPQLTRHLIEGGLQDVLQRSGRGLFSSYRSGVLNLLASLPGTVHEDFLVKNALGATNLTPDSKSDLIVVLTSAINREDVLARLLELTADPDESVRRSAAKALTSATDREGVLARLLELTADPDESVRRSAVQALAAATDREGVLARLLELTADSDSRVRWSGVQALAAATDREGVLARLLELTADSDSRVRWSGVQALAAATDREGVLARLLELTADSDSHVRWSGVQALAAATDREGVLARLLELTADPDESVRWSAAEVLAEATDREGVLARLLELTADPDESVRWSAAQALAEATDREDVLARLLELTADPDESVRWSAAQALAAATDREDVLARLLELTADPDESVRSSAAQALAAATDREDVLARLLELTADPDESVRSSAAQALAAATDREDVLPRLLELTADPDESVRSSAAEALAAAIDREDVLARLLELTADSDSRVRWSAAQALAAATDREELMKRMMALLSDQGMAAVAEKLHAFMRSDAPYLQRVEVVSLMTALQLHNVGQASQLMDGLLDRDNDVRRACARGLAEIGKVSAERENRVCDLLVAALDDPRFDVEDEYEYRPARDYAYEGLRMLMGVDTIA